MHPVVPHRPAPRTREPVWLQSRDRAVDFYTWSTSVYVGHDL